MITDFDLIKRYLEKSGMYEVQYVEYYFQGENALLASSTVNLGLANGIPAGRGFFLGNIDLRVYLGGVINPALSNNLYVTTRTLLIGITEVAGARWDISVGNGLNLLGDGTYKAHKRVYGVGLTEIAFTIQNVGAAAMGYDWSFNGLVFRLK